MKLLYSLLFITNCLVASAQVDTLKTGDKKLSIEKTGSTTPTRFNSEPFFPAITFENPLSAGTLGMVVLGANVENQTRIYTSPDANIAAYVGLGRPDKFVGGGVTLNIYGLSNSVGEKKNQGQGSLSFHVNRLLLKQRLLIDAGVDNLIFWGGDLLFDQTFMSYQKSFYLSANYLFQLRQGTYDKPFSYVSVTGGVGNGYYRTDNHYTFGKSGSFDPFASLATPLFKGTNIIGEWNGYDIGTGISSIPFQKFPLMFTFEVTDIVFGSPRKIVSLSLPFWIKKSKKAGNDVQVRPVFTKPIRAVRTM